MNENNKLRSEEGKVLYLGLQYSFILKPEMNQSYKIDYDNHIIYAGKDMLKNKKYRESFYKLQARIFLKERAYLLSQKHGIEIKKVGVRRAYRRWGSCNSIKEISLCEFLILAPIEAIDAVIYHELAHTFVMNHSKNFYAKLISLYPNYYKSHEILKRISRAYD